MLYTLTIKDCGPSSLLKANFGSRPNLITGGNGLGKTFLLDAAWFSLSGTWSQDPIGPHMGPNKEPSIKASCGATPREKSFEAQWNSMRLNWVTKPGRPTKPSIVIYARADGGFSIWDPARNSQKAGSNRPKAYHLSQNEIWNGYPLDSTQKFCNGLIADLAQWQREAGGPFGKFKCVLTGLSKSWEETLHPGPLTRLALANDVREFPTLMGGNLGPTPAIYASSAVKRILALAYLLVWTWEEHLLACSWTEEQKAQEIILLVDDAERHLHPKWQGAVVPSLLQVLKSLTEITQTQLIVSTHAPMILASLEPLFDKINDKIFHLALGSNKQKVVLKEYDWLPQGDASNWLTSEIFGLPTSRNPLIAKQMDDFSHLIDSNFATPDKVKKYYEQLARNLNPTDPFLFRALAICKERGLI